MNFSELLFYITIYSFLGWCVEVVYHTVNYGEFSNRGFVGGPVCTIYGVGFTGVTILLSPFRDNVFVLFPVSVLLATALEFITGWVLEKVFHEKWWDYSKQPFNLKGYICLRFSIIWGLACTGTLMIVHPLIEKVYRAIPKKVCTVFLIVAFAVYLTDWCVTVLEIRKIRVRLRIAKNVADLMDDVSDFIGTGLHEGTITAMEKGEDGKEILIHVGLDTVNLNGEGFKVFVQEGDKVEKGQQIMKADIQWIRERGFNPMIIVVQIES